MHCNYLSDNMTGEEKHFFDECSEVAKENEAAATGQNKQ